MILLLIIFVRQEVSLWQFQSNCEYLDFQDSPRCEGDPLDRFCSCLRVGTMR